MQGKLWLVIGMKLALELMVSFGRQLDFPDHAQIRMLLARSAAALTTSTSLAVASVVRLCGCYILIVSS